MNSDRATGNYELCQKYVRYSQLVIKIVPAMLGVFVVLQVGPRYIQYIISGTYIPSMGVYLPGLDPSQLSHLIVLELPNLATIIVGVLMENAIYSLIFIVLINLILISNIITGELNELETVLKNGKTDEREIKRRLIKIILMHQQYNE